MTKKQLKNLAYQYIFYAEHEKEFSERLQGFITALQITGELKKVKNEAFRLKNYLFIDQINEIERLVNKAMDDKKAFDVDLLEDYLFDIEFLENLNIEEKRLLKANLEYLIPRMEIIEQKEKIA